jgi:hypothetical protein
MFFDFENILTTPFPQGLPVKKSPSGSCRRKKGRLQTLIIGNYLISRKPPVR